LGILLELETLIHCLRMGFAFDSFLKVGFTFYIT
jgi:hypothetical protein